MSTLFEGCFIRPRPPDSPARRAALRRQTLCGSAQRVLSLTARWGAYRFSVIGSGLGLTASTAGLAAVAVNAVVAALVFNAPTALATPTVPRPPDPHDVVFIGHLADHGVPYASVPAAITLAQATCSILSTGSPTRIEHAVMTIRDGITMRPDQAQSFAETAVSVYCPGCADRLGLTPARLGPASATVGTGFEPPPRKVPRVGY
jgi:uncharacterized protein DUF732